MTEHQGLPVAGYRPQGDRRIDEVNENKRIEERLLRRLDRMQDVTTFQAKDDEEMVDLRWLAIARTHFEQGFMALNRAIFQPGRIKLPEDPL